MVSGERADDQMSFEVEVEGAAPEGLAERIAETIREVTKLRGSVAIHTPGSLPNDGKVIEDTRRYD